MRSALAAAVRWATLGALCLLLVPSPARAQDEGSGGGDSSGESAGDGDSAGSASSQVDGSGEGGDDRTEDSNVWESSSSGKSD